MNKWTTSAARLARGGWIVRPEELEFNLHDLGAEAVVVSAAVDTPARDVAKRLELKVLELVYSADQEAGRFRFEGISRQPAPAADCARLDDDALMLHTSGTTSRPKLVPLTHRNLCASARNIQESLALTPDDCCLNVMPLFHVHGLVGALLSSIAAGAAVVCCPGYQDGEFLTWMREFETSWYTAVPTIHQSVLSRARSERLRKSSLSSRLRFIRSSSSALSPNIHGGTGSDVRTKTSLRRSCRRTEPTFVKRNLREFAFSRLAEFKVLSQIVFIDAIPKGPTGKLQRIGLHEKLNDELRRECVTPRTEMEEILVELWREVLPVDQIGVHDNFFGSSGDSLAAGRLVARINSRFELDLAVTTVFRAPSIAAQAVLVESALLDQIESQ